MQSRFTDLADLHVLVVDDDANSRTMYADVFAYCGALVSCAASARGALQMLDSVTPDVVLTDLQLPVDDGHWLLRQLRRHRKMRDVPVLLVTASVELNERAARQAGFDDYLTKPTNLRNLCQTVRQLADRHRCAHQCILLVEDDADTRKALARALRLTGFDVVTAPDGKSALVAARAQHFDALVTDLGMPDIPGHAVIREVLAREDRPRRVIAMTGYGLPFQAMAEAAGADVILTKPFEVGTLIDAIGGTSELKAA